MSVCFSVLNICRLSNMSLIRMSYWSASGKLYFKLFLLCKTIIYSDIYIF